MAFLLSLRVHAARPAISDPGISPGETSVYRLVKQSGAVSSSTQRVTVEQRGGIAVYRIESDSNTLVLTKADLTPLEIENRNPDGSVNFQRKYSGDRVNIIYPGPRRNQVEKVNANRYDVNSIIYVVRGIPPTGQNRVEFTLVAEEHIIDVYFAETGTERVTVPAGTFDCKKYEAGLTGLKGRVFKKKIYFWVEKNKPYRLIRQEDEGVSDTRLVELVSSKGGAAK